MEDKDKKIEVEDNASIIELFGQKIELKKEDDNKDNVEDVDKNKKEEEDIVLFEGGEQDKVPEDKESVPEEVVERDNEIVNLLIEKGYIDKDEDIDETIDPLMYVVEKETEDKLKSLLEGVPTIVKELVHYHANGGDVYEYLQKVYNEEFDITRLDPNNSADQIKIVTEKLKMEGYEDDDIEQQINIYKELGKLDIYAKKFHNILVKKHQEKKERLKREKEAMIRQEKERVRRFREDVKNYIKTKRSVFNITLNAKDVKELPDYMTSRTVKLENGSVITPMQYDLMVALNDKDKAIFVAKLLRSNFDLTEIMKDVETKITRKVKKTLVSNKSSGKVRSLADLL